MDVRISFAEDEGLEVLQADGDESGYEVAETHYQTYLVDGVRHKTVTVVMVETDALVEDEEEYTDGYGMSEYDQGYQDGEADANFWREYKDGENQQASVDSRTRCARTIGTVPASGGARPQSPAPDFFNRR